MKYPQREGLYDRAFEHDACGIGFVAHIKGERSFDIIARGLEVLKRMEHRGAESADNKTGDGAGILMQIPHAFYLAEVPSLPAEGEYGTGIVFLPKDREARDFCKKTLEQTAAEEGQRVISWRKLPVDATVVGAIALSSMPGMEQIFITGTSAQSRERLERKLFVIRKLCERKVKETSFDTSSFYINSLSSKSIVYKGMLMPDQVGAFYADLRDTRMTSAVALVHSRFSTNTFPAWELAQPFRMIAHNGEINTVKGNRFWMSARESLFASKEFDDDIKKILPVIEEGRSDSASFDNALEMLVATGRSLPHALMMMVPESWNDKNPVSDDLKKFYEYHATFMEPWDGPASIVFFDGRYIGGTLDRNGLRPSRYIITKDNLIVMGSEVGVQDIDPSNIAYKGRLMPGKLLLVDIVEQRIIPDHEIKQTIVHQKPYSEWVSNHRLPFEAVPKKESHTSIKDDALHKMHLLFGYNREEIEKLIPELAKEGQEITGSMGTDTPIAVFSDIPQRLFNYFKQVFAQVTNPPIDPIREELVMTLTSFIGRQKNLLEQTPEHCRLIKLLSPVISDNELESLRLFDAPEFESVTLDAVFSADEGKPGLKRAMKRLCREAEQAIESGKTFIILSDRKADAYNVPVPSLLACAGVHHHLIRQKKRTQCSIFIESAEPREVHHFCLLFGYGADLINPYGAFATILDQTKKGYLGDMPYKEGQAHFIKGIQKGILKVLSKMGTSTLRSYRAAQVFEAIGLGKGLIDEYFTNTPSRIGGIGIDELAEEALRAHSYAFEEAPALVRSEGVYAWRKSGERHAWNPETIHLLQWATRTANYQLFKKFSTAINELNRAPHVIRGLFDFVDFTPVPIEEVEGVEAIMKRFTTGAMSYGSISAEAHEAIATALNSIKGRSNSGEGGEDPARYLPKADGTSTRSAIKQVASGRFGVTSNYLTNADEIQIKIAQGAKPGEGGQLPGHKVNEIIAKTRFSTPGVTLISPPPHHDIYSIEDLAQLIFDLKNANPGARISVKLVSESGVGTVAAGVAKAHADNILISGYDGGTGASPQSSIKHAGLPWEIGMSETHQTLVLNELRDRVRMQTDGQIKTGRDIVLAGILGAEEFGFATSVLVVLGCTLMRKCHLNTCPFGVATQDEKLREKFSGRPEYLINFFRFLAEEVREIMAQLGVRKFDELIGATQLLRVRTDVTHWKARLVDPSPLLHKPAKADSRANHCTTDQIHKIDAVLDRTIIADCGEALKAKKPIVRDYLIKNTDRTVGAMLSHEISKKYGEAGLPEGTIKVHFNGSAGQSFGAFLAKGVSFTLEGDANDYLGKGLSGGRIVVMPPHTSDFAAEDNIIIGNTVLYGATGGELYVRGVAGERFCVRNSGALAVVEGTGDHCAEYMTGGRLVVLGQVGRNFAAGMSGGIAYVYDVNKNFDYFCNKGMVELSPIKNAEDEYFLKTTIACHAELTGSRLASVMLHNWNGYLYRFVKVMPLEYKRALQEMKLKKIDARLEDIRAEEGLGRSI